MERLDFSIVEDDHKKYKYSFDSERFIYSMFDSYGSRDRQSSCLKNYFNYKVANSLENGKIINVPKDKRPYILIQAIKDVMPFLLVDNEEVYFDYYFIGHVHHWFNNYNIPNCCNRRSDALDFNFKITPKCRCECDKSYMINMQVYFCQCCIKVGRVFLSDAI